MRLISGNKVSPVLIPVYAVFFALNGCIPNAHLATNTSAVNSSSNEIAEATANNAVGEPPLKVEIAQAFFDHGKLNVKVRLQAKTSVNPAEVVVLLSGLREGSVVEEKAERLDSAFADKVMDSGETAVLRFELDSSDLTEYQVQCSWGSDAISLISDKNLRASLSTGEVGQAKADGSQDGTPSIEQQAEAAFSLTEIKLEAQESSCSNPPCDKMFTIYGSLINRTQSDVGEVQLALGLFWTNEGAKVSEIQAQAPKLENEEVIQLEDVVVKPGEKKRIRVKVDKPVPIVPGGAFVPRLRLLGFQVRNHG